MMHALSQRIAPRAAALAAPIVLGMILALPGRPRAAGKAQAADELRVFEADLGQAWIDVSDYPEEQRQAYVVFARKCSKCHTLARPINSSMRGEEWTSYVHRMSRKPGSGITPKEAEAILGFLMFDSERRVRQGGSVDPELVPYVKVSEELGGVERFPASVRDIRIENGSLRVMVEGDRRLDLSRFLANGGGQKLVKWTRRSPNRGEIVIRESEGQGDGKKADPVESTSDPDLLLALAEAVGSESDPRERVELVLDWLDETLVREYRPGTADLKAILGDPRGDATEFTRAFVAMSRAAGIPARTCLGFVARRTAFYLHPWAEVWLDGWVPVDPYLGQLPADLTHIRLAVPGEDAMADWDAGSVPGLDRLERRVVASDGGGGEPGGRGS